MENADQVYLHNLSLLQKKAVRAITVSDFNAHTSPIFKELEILKLNDTYEYKLSSLMWDYEHDSLTNSLFCLFKKRSDTLSRNTIFSVSGKLSINKSNTKKYGLKSFHVQGSKISNVCYKNWIRVPQLIFHGFLPTSLKISRTFKGSPWNITRGTLIDIPRILPISLKISRIFQGIPWNITWGTPNWYSTDFYLYHWRFNSFLKKVRGISLGVP